MCLCVPSQPEQSDTAAEERERGVVEMSERKSKQETFSANCKDLVSYIRPTGGRGGDGRAMCYAQKSEN